MLSKGQELRRNVVEFLTLEDRIVFVKKKVKQKGSEKVSTLST